MLAILPHGNASLCARGRPLRPRARPAPARHRAQRCSSLRIEEIFFRFTKFREWDASEMSFGKIVSLMAEPDPPIIALPVFVSRVFRHSAIYVRKGSGIAHAEGPGGQARRHAGMGADRDHLRARHAGSTNTASTCAASPGRQAGVREPGRVEKVQLHLPPGLRVHAGAGAHARRHARQGRARRRRSRRATPAASACSPTIREPELEYFRKTRIFPIMHVVVLRRDVYERDRWIAMNLLKAFEEAKQPQPGARRRDRRLAGAGALGRRPCAPLARGRGRGLLALRPRAKPRRRWKPSCSTRFEQGVCRAAPEGRRSCSPPRPSSAPRSRSVDDESTSAWRASTFAQRAVSARMVASNCSGVIAIGSAPSARQALRAPRAPASPVSRLAGSGVRTISRGVFAGANRPTQKM